MAKDDGNFADVCWRTRAQRLKNRQKPTNFAIFYPGWTRARPIARPPGADLAKILHCKWARVWQLMIGISLMSVDVLGRNGWKTVKNGKNHQFLTVFHPLHPHMSTHISEISIICCHILACLPHKILAESAHRWPSNRPARVLTVRSFAHYSEYTGCLTVSDNFETPLISGLGWRNLIYFYVVKVGGLRFFLVYNTQWYGFMGDWKLRDMFWVNL